MDVLGATSCTLGKMQGKLNKLWAWAKTKEQTCSLQAQVAAVERLQKISTNI